MQPRTVITSPEWSGIEAHGRRYAPFTQNVEREKPWHTLSGRQHFYLDHAWMLELGEGLPVFRPPLHHRAIFGDQGAQDGSGRRELTLKYLTPHSKWSIHSEYQDNLHMLTLFRGGGMLWISREDAQALEISDNDWVEAYNRNGVVACRATVSHRIPEGTCLMYHAKDRHLNVPLTELQGKRGGTDNSLTRIVMKPTHFIGGYAQLQLRLQLLRAHGLPARRGHRAAQAPGGGDLRMRIRAQVGMVMNLDKCIGCHTCSVTCKQVWTNRPGAEYMWFNDVETKPGLGYPKRWEDQEHWRGGWELDRKGRLRLKAGGRDQEAAVDLLQPRPAADRRLLRALDLRLREADHRAAVRARPGGAGPLAADRQGAAGDPVGAQLGRQPRRRARADPRGPARRAGSRSRSRPPTSRRSCSTCRGSASTA